MTSLETLKSDITSLGADVHVDVSTPDLFFFRGAERRMPFATIVTRDTEFDSFARLDGDGSFRLNIALGRERFGEMFPEHTTRSALETAEFDYAARDEFMPHPVYGRMHWACVINPDNTYARCRILLGRAYELARQ